MIPENIRKEFPIFDNRPEMTYLDSAATALTPAPVIEAVSTYYRELSANVGRGLYPTAEETTARFESVRERISRFLNTSSDEIVFTRNSTEGLNLLAATLADRIEEGDNIVITALEHHSNFLPWKRLTKRCGAELRIVPFEKDGSIHPDTARSFVDSRTKIFAFSAISNVFGTPNDVSTIVRTAKALNPDILTVIDAAQAIGHMQVDIQEWNCDFLAFSGHKCFGPTGVGILFGKHDILSSLPPYQVGGGMVLDSTADEPTYMDVPHRFEAGTPDIASVFGLDAALDFIDSIGVDAIHAYESELATQAVSKLKKAFGDSIHILGFNDRRESGIVSFTLEGIHPHDIAQILGERDICIRAGEHCATPLHHVLSLPATARVSFSVYNTEEDIDRLIEGLKEVRSLFEN
ncbi:MAG: cysteine desulfurase [Candidatus Moranbacteria bacterium]|nr:cysteine desulfurase [Candidatus Moranbacteria bacterium]